MGQRFALVVVLMTIILFAAGCKDKEEPPKEELPSEALAAYLAAWQKLDFEAMYDRLTPEAQAKQTKEAFAERYRKIYDGIEAVNLTAEPVAPAPSPTTSASPEGSADVELTETSLEYRVSMDTMAGSIRFEHEAKLKKTTLLDPEGKEEKKWRIDWEPSLLFPGMAEGDKVRVQKTRGERGEILDRNGNGLAMNGTAMQLGIVPGKLGDQPEATKAKLAQLLGIEAADIDKKLSAKWVKPDLFVPIAVVDEEDLEKFADVPGIDYQQKKIRAYPYGEATAHLTGYIGEISAEQLEKKKDQGYAVGDLIGKAGMEQVFEDRLRGSAGAKIFIASSDGREKEILAEQPAEDGETIRLTIDADLQTAMYNELKKESSTAAAIQPVSGEVLALLSTPSYDPNAFVRGMSDEQYKAWNDDPRHPFLNRFTKGYAPGSAFKLITAAMGLDTGTLDPAKKENISGLTWTKDASWGKYYVKRVHEVNPVDLSRALIYSDNIYFAQAALRIGPEKFLEEAAKFGIGEDLPLEYPFRKSQLANDGLRGEILLADTGYGQGEVIMTSLHVALLYSTLVNDGSVVRPVLALNPDGETAPRLWKEHAMKPETAALLKQDLIEAVSKPDGVGHGAYIQGASIAGKTGTAEIKQTKEGDGTENGWFVGFNAADPKLLAAVMVEGVQGKGGSAYVTPMVKRIFEYSLKHPSR